MPSAMEHASPLFNSASRLSSSLVLKVVVVPSCDVCVTPLLSSASIEAISAFLSIIRFGFLYWVKPTLIERTIAAITPDPVELNPVITPQLYGVSKLSERGGLRTATTHTLFT